MELWRKQAGWPADGRESMPEVIFSGTEGRLEGRYHHSRKAGAPIALHPYNPNYLKYRGKGVILIGASEHYGAVVNRDFDWRTYLDTLAAEQLNLTRVFVGSYYALYFSGLFAAALPVHGAHVFMNLHFMVSGLLFFWPLIGVDPAPRHLPPAARLGIVFASVPFHAFFGVALMSADTVIGGGFYRALALPWVTDPLRDQQAGGGLAWASPWHQHTPTGVSSTIAGGQRGA